VGLCLRDRGAFQVVIRLYAVRTSKYGTTTRPSSIVHAGGLSLDSPPQPLRLSGRTLESRSSLVSSLVLAAFSLSLGLIIPLLTYSGTILWLHFGSTLSFIALEFYALRLYG
jgi:hypothetical protein